MAHSHHARALSSMVRQCHSLDISDPVIQCLAPRLSRSFASQTSMPIAELAGEMQKAENLSVPRPQAVHHSSHASSPSPKQSQVLTMLYSWPSLKPTRFHSYPSSHLALPLRRDILHRAVIYEADNSRQGTASTKYRTQVHGSNRKIIPQKGTGQARAGDKKSPIRRGGGVAFGPHPRDFGTELQRKVYDLAWRTALSYRYRKGELVVVDGEMTIPRTTGGRLLNNIFEGNQWGKANGRSLLVTQRVNDRLYKGMEQIGQHGLVKDLQDVDVKDLLETGRVVIEQAALEALFLAHQSDLGTKLGLTEAIRRARSDVGLPELKANKKGEFPPVGIVTDKEIEELGSYVLG